MKLKHLEYKVLINPSKIPQLNGYRIINNGTIFGAAITLTEMQEALQYIITTQPGKSLLFYLKFY